MSSRQLENPVKMKKTVLCIFMVPLYSISRSLNRKFLSRQVSKDHYLGSKGCSANSILGSHLLGQQKKVSRLPLIIHPENQEDNLEGAHSGY